VHLAEAHDGDGAWMRYLHREFFPDDDFRNFVDRLLHGLGPGDELDLVFGGDLFEFEGPRVVDREIQFDDRPRTEDNALETLDRIVADHPTFFRAIGAVVDAGHRVVFVVGNHDAQLGFPRVEQRLRQHVARFVTKVPVERLAARVRVRPWFFQTADGVHVEHGHQYDTWCAFRDPLRPLGPQGREIHPTVGSEAFRHLISRMGFFNAYDERTFMLSGPRYLAHWARHYLFSKHSLAATWAVGALRVFGTMLAARPPRELAAVIRREAAAARARFAERHTLEWARLERHAALFAQPADDQPHRVVRELRLDRLALGALAVAGLLVSAVKPKLGLAVSASAVLLGMVHELVGPTVGFDAEYVRVDQVARKIAAIYRARAVIFGHTHIPGCEIEDGVLFANTGAWAPDAPSADVDEAPPPRKTGRPIVWLRRPADDRGAPIEGGLYRFGEGELEAQVEATTRERTSMFGELRPTVV